MGLTFEQGRLVLPAKIVDRWIVDQRVALSVIGWNSTAKTIVGIASSATRREIWSITSITLALPTRQEWGLIQSSGGIGTSRAPAAATPTSDISQAPRAPMRATIGRV